VQRLTGHSISGNLCTSLQPARYLNKL
jgi:hypothetical protein